MRQNPFFTQDTCFAIIGLGISGKAALRYAQAHGAKILVSDTRDEEALVQDLQEFSGDISPESGGHSYEFLSQADLVFVSAGVGCNELLDRLRKDGVQLVGELSLLAPVIDKPVIAITGTNGKTTETSLIGKLLQAGGKKVFVGGNIGTPIFEYALSEEDVDFLVLELSSFQLDWIGDFAIHGAILLNITPDHIDRHGSLEAYQRAKMAIFSNQKEDDIAIINGDDSLCDCRNFAGNGKVYGFGFSEKSEISIYENEIYFTLSKELEKYSLVDTALDNRTGWLNTAPAIFMARQCGCSQEDIIKGLKSFEIDRHRVEKVATLDGVTYYNDSKATNTGAVNSALEQFNNVILIAGGLDKGDDYRLLRENVQARVKQLICIGQATPLISDALEDIVPIYKASSLQDALDFAEEKSVAGDTVLFSPACASFDMFKSYKDRGDQFCRRVLAKKGDM